MDIYKTVSLVAPTDASVLISGESGAGGFGYSVALSADGDTALSQAMAGSDQQFAREIVRTLMDGAENEPLLVLDHKGKGRVATGG